MKALFLFHLRVGVRVAVRSFIPLFAAMLSFIMLQIDPAGLVTGVALRTFAPRPRVNDLLPVVILAILVPMYAAPRLSLGLSGWMRHLGFSSRGNKRGLIFSFAITQVPLGISLVLLGVIARLHGVNVWFAAPRLCLLLAASVYCALPVNRRLPTVMLALFAMACSLSGELPLNLLCIGLLAAADFVSGDIRKLSPQKPWGAVGSLFEFRMAWRALGWRLPLQYVPALLITGATALFASNNELRGSFLAGAARFGGCIAIAVFLALASTKLAERRPPWPWARSFPISSYWRVASDSLFLGCHAAPLLVLAALIDPPAIWLVLLTLPLFSVRAAAHVRKISERRTGAAAYLLECSCAAALLALLPWSVVFWILASVPAFFSARKTDAGQKVSRWLELHYMVAGDPLSWSNQ